MSSQESAANQHLVIPSLDGLRALSFLLVFAGHTGAPGIPAGFGVTVFFFLSGYLITTLLRLELERTGTIDFKAFYLRRVLRIWPPFYLVLAAGVLITYAGVLSNELHVAPIAAQIGHVYNYWTIIRNWKYVVPGSGVYWSLAVEEHFYLLFPALYWALSRRKLESSALCTCFLGLCALVLVWRCVLVFHFGAPPPQTFVATDTRIDSILFGCCLAVWKNPALERTQVALAPAPRDLFASAAAVIVLLVTFLIRVDAFRETIRYTLQGIALAPLFSFVVRFPRWGIVRLLNLRVLKLLGALSYSMYLTHHTLLEIAHTYLPNVGWPGRAAVALAACLVLSRLLYVFVETPCAALRKRLGRRSETLAAERAIAA